MPGSTQETLCVAAAAAAASGLIVYALMARQQPPPPEEESGTGSLDTAMHRLNSRLQSVGRAKSVRGAKAYRAEPTKTHVVRVALTGGPCAGKSSALARLTSLATKEGFDVYVAPESATLLFNSGVVVDWADSEANYNFQVALMRYACGCVHV